MNYDIKEVNLCDLLPHESVDLSQVEMMVASFKNSDGRFVPPIIIDKESKVVLDGHHRLEAHKRLAIPKIMVIEVYYQADDILVLSKQGYTKDSIIASARAGKLLAPKATLHMVEQNQRLLPLKLYFHLIAA